MAGMVSQAGRDALPRQGFTHLFPGRRGLCNARSLRVPGGGADQIRDPVTRQPSLAKQDRLPLKRPVTNGVRRFHANFTYQAGSWTKPRRVRQS